MNNQRTVDIIGAGISGLSTAYYLDKLNKNLHIRIWEKDSGPGGLAGNFNTEDFSVEKFYHHFFKRDVAIQSLVNELGLEQYLKWNKATTGAYYFKQPYRISSPLDILKFKPLPFLDRIRLVYMLFLAKQTRNWDKVDNISAIDYILKHAGENVYRILWEPLLKGKFGKYAEEISAAWLCSKVVDRGGSRTKTGFEYLAFIDGGLGIVFDSIETLLRSKGHTINYNCNVDNLEIKDSTTIKSISCNGKKCNADLVISCTQLPNLVKILPDSLEAYKKELNSIKFLGNVCLVLLLRRSLSDFYWTNVTNPNAPFVGIIEHTKWADITGNKNEHLVYISSYITNDDKRIKMSSDELLEYYFNYICEIFPDFDRNDIIKSYKWYEPYTQPIVNIGYRKKIPKIESPLDNMYVCTMAQIYPHDRQVSNGVEMALKTVELIKKNHLK
jgi:protoporphyrinogen oxidase